MFNITFYRMTDGTAPVEEFLSIENAALPSKTGQTI